MYECEYCNEVFENGKVKANHVRWNHKYDESGYSDEGLESMRTKAEKSLTERYGEKVEEQRICEECEEKFEVSYRKEDSNRSKRKFCSRSCAVSYNNKKRERSEETKKKISESLKSFYSSDEGRRCIEKSIRKRGDRNKKDYKQNPSLCEICETKLSYEKRTRKTCSEDCYKKLKRKRAEEIEGFGEGVNPSKTFWYYNKWQDKEVALDSSWELDYAKQLDENNVKWKRPDYIEWVDEEGSKRKYYPDFYIVDKDYYVDVKNDYLANLKKTKEKLERVRLQNDIKLKVLRSEDSQVIG